MARSDTLHAEIARGVSGKLEHLGTKVLADGGHVHGRGRTNAAVAGHAVFQMPMDTAHGKLQPQGGATGRVYVGESAIAAQGA